MFRLKITWSLSCVFWMQIGKRIRLEQHYWLLYMELQIQRQVHLRLYQGKAINRENNTRRFWNVEQLARSVRSVQVSMVDTYENVNFSQRNWCARNRIRIDWTWKWTLGKTIRNTVRMVEHVSITGIVSWCVWKNLFENEERTRLYLRLQKLYI